MKEVKVRKIQEGAVVPQPVKGDMYDLSSVQVDLGKQGFLDIAGKLKFDASYLEKYKKGDTIHYGVGDVLIVHTGLAMELPEGHFAKCYPRSSTFAKYGLILTNSVGVIDHTYKGNNDEWKFVFYATRPGSVTVGERFTQFEIVESTVKNFTFKEVSNLESRDRGGFGSTDK